MHGFSRMSRPYLTCHLPTASSGCCGFTALSQSKEKPYSLLLSSLAVCQPACLLQEPDGVSNHLQIRLLLLFWAIQWLPCLPMLLGAPSS
jgi:hypothetical protein